MCQMLQMRTENWPLGAAAWRSLVTLRRAISGVEAGTSPTGAGSSGRRGHGTMSLDNTSGEFCYKGEHRDTW